MNGQTANIALSLLAFRLGYGNAKLLRDAAGNALAVFENRNDIRAVAPDATDRLCEIMKGDIAEIMQRTEEEQQWAAEHGVSIVTIDDSRYPDRLRQCPDAPLVLYVRGDADLSASCMLAVVGTRKCTTYGRDAIEQVIHDLKTLCPAMVVVSGLAYGVDICAHRASLHEGLSTIGVVAHGQDTLYPMLHRAEANKMLENNGAVITEYIHGTRPLAGNFLQRNRIVAGMTDATLVVESASHGGSLVTARIAQDYGREVFAVPGPIRSEQSSGCNNLIRDNKAQLVTSAQDIVNAMGWQCEEILRKARQQGIERTMFANLSAEEQKVIDTLKEHGDTAINDLTQLTALPVASLQQMLFILEMQGMVKSLPGNVYHVIK